MTYGHQVLGTAPTPVADAEEANGEDDDKRRARTVPGNNLGENGAKDPALARGSQWRSGCASGCGTPSANSVSPGRGSPAMPGWTLEERPRWARVRGAISADIAKPLGAGWRIPATSE